jgi:DNA-binding SARP family transcriptional activator
VLSERGSLRIRLLGPVAAELERRLLALGGPKQRAVLATLALQPGCVVPVDRLLEAVWGEQPPTGAAKTLQVYVANLRRTLEPDRGSGSPPAVLLTREPGYLLAVEPEQVDAARVESAMARARGLVADGQLVDGVRRLREALDDWRGVPLAGLEALPLHQLAASRLQELRLDALELCCAAELDLGFADALVPELESLVRESPYRERLWALLIRALYASGRQRDALAAFQNVRRVLLDDLGVEPGPELREIERRVLVQDATLDVIAAAVPPAHGALDDIVRKRVSVVATVGPLDARALSTMAIDHGGTVIERGPDMFVIAFGTPRLRLDDADRAAVLALALQRSGQSVGVATGWASASDATVSGAPVSRATELARVASRGRALLDATSRDLLAGRATVEPAAGGTAMLLDLTVLPPDAAEAGPFVGRDAELELLTSVWNAVHRTRRPSVVTLVGSSGIGTSRLVLELAARVGAPLLRVDLDLTAEAEGLLDRLSTAPDGSIVLFEHVHRATRAASWAMAQWAGADPTGVVLCVATATPDLRAMAPGWPGTVSLAMTMDLSPLDQEATGRLAAHLLGDEVVGARAASVAAISRGNPLFVSELATHLTTVGDDARLPDRLATLLTSRVEELTPMARRSLEAVAVLGATDAERIDALSDHATGALDDPVAFGLVRIDDDGRITMPEVVSDVVVTIMSDERAVALHERAAEVAATLTARAAHLEQAARRLPAGVEAPLASAAVDALAELAWRTWSRGDIESSVDALHRATGIASSAPIDLIERVRAGRRRLASHVLAGRLGGLRADVPLRASVGAWDASRPVEQDLAAAASALAAVTPHAHLRDQCQAVARALCGRDPGDQGSSASSSA